MMCLSRMCFTKVAVFFFTLVKLSLLTSLTCTFTEVQDNLTGLGESTGIGRLKEVEDYGYLHKVP